MLLFALFVCFVSFLSFVSFRSAKKGGMHQKCGALALTRLREENNGDPSNRIKAGTAHRAFVGRAGLHVLPHDRPEKGCRDRRRTLTCHTKTRTPSLCENHDWWTTT